MERRLFNNGGYVLDNGATLCGAHHLEAERTILSCESIRKAAGITSVVLPDHLYSDEQWDKWGNMILSNGGRIRGELFDDSSVQKVLKAARVLPLFLKWVKYPRTYHLPGSPGGTRDDRFIRDTEMFRGKRVIITEKRDGENTTLYNDYVHARSLDSGGHPTRHWMQNYHSKFGWCIPGGWRVCGENLWAKHAILYTQLGSFFEAFSIWDQGNMCLGWDSSLEWFELLDVPHVPVLYDGLWNDELIERFVPSDVATQEGFVVRLAEGFHYSRFRFSVAKWVRENHVQTTHNWKRQKIVRNQLRKPE
jgi:hypothetical protein